MLYNKNEVSKVNNRKVLHKVGKNWKVISIALLMAIGGTAVATNVNANADTTADAQATTNVSSNLGATQSATSSTQSNANVNAQLSPQTKATVQSLEANPPVQKPISVSSNNTSANSSVASSSATSAVSANSATSASSNSVSYVSGDTGSATSYHAKALSDSSVIQNNSATVSNYVQSLNNRFPKETSQLNQSYASASTKENNDQSLATSYTNVAKQSNYSAKVSTLASSAGLTTSDYTDSVEAQTNYYSYAVSDGQSNVNKLQSAKSLVLSAYNVKHNSSVSDNAQVSLAYASANDVIANDNYSAANTMLSALYNEQNNYYSTSASFAITKFNDEVAIGNSSADAMATNSLASDFGLGDSTETSSLVGSLAQSSVASSGYVSLNSKAVSYNVKSNINANVYQLLSDTYTMNHFAESIPSMVDENSLSSAISSQEDVVNDDELNVTVASEELSDAQGVADGDLNLASLGNFEDTGTLADLAAYGANDSTAMSAMNSEISSAEQSLSDLEVQSASYASSTNNELAVAKDYASNYENLAKSDKLAVTQAREALIRFEKAYAPSDVAKAMEAVEKAKIDLPNSNALANAFGIHVYNFAPKYVNVTKDLMIHTNTEYTKQNAVEKVPAGSTLRVLGVGFDQNGRLRYRVSVNGTNGFVTGNPQYTEGTYLFAGKRVNVTVNQRGIREYTGTTPIKKLPEGTQLTGKVVSEPDSNFNNDTVYGAYTRIQLDNGDFVTANTKFYSNVTPVEPQKPSNPNNVPVYFD